METDFEIDIVHLLLFPSQTSQIFDTLYKNNNPYEKRKKDVH